MRYKNFLILGFLFVFLAGALIFSVLGLVSADVLSIGSGSVV